MHLIFRFFLFFYYVLKSIVLKCIPIQYHSKKNISGQIALITGAGGGIGRLLALKFADLGCKVVCWDVAKQANDETVRLIKEAKGEAYGYQIDLTKKAEIYRVAKLVQIEIGKVDILINNAGVVSGKSISECTDEQIMRTFDVNVLSQFWTIKSFLPAMKNEKKGHIVNIASIAGLTGVNRLVDYCSSKFAVVGLNEALNVELAIENHSEIKTTVICPFFVATPLFQGIKSRIVPVLEPEQVAEDTVNAILTDQVFCIVPGYLTLLVIIKNMIPEKAMEQLIHLFDMHETMNAFEGPKTKYQ